MTSTALTDNGQPTGVHHFADGSYIPFPLVEPDVPPPFPLRAVALAKGDLVIFSAPERLTAIRRDPWGRFYDFVLDVECTHGQSARVNKRAEGGYQLICRPCKNTGRLNVAPVDWAGIEKEKEQRAIYRAQERERGQGRG